MVWVTASSRELLVSQLSTIAVLAGVGKDDLAPEDNASRLVTWLSSAGPDPTGEVSHRLLIFDNVENADDVAGLIPEAPGLRVLVTTTSTTCTLGTRVPVGLYTPEQASTFLLEQTGGRLSADEAQLIAEDLGRLPVAITQAASAIRELGYSGAQYRTLLDEAAEVDAAMLREEGDPYPAPVGAALWIAVDAVLNTLRASDADQADAAVQVLDALSLLAPKASPGRGCTVSARTSTWHAARSRHWPMHL